MTSRNALVLEIVRVLAVQVRVMTLAQIIRGWFPGTPSKAVRGGFQAAIDNGLVAEHPVLVYPELPLVEPIVKWHAGEAAPDVERVAYALQRRWVSSLKRETVFAATPKAVRVYGGLINRKRSSGLRNQLQVTHDLHVSAIFLKVREERIDWRDCWTSEDQLPAVKRAKLPDAIVSSPEGNSVFVEFGGAYRSERVRRVHEHCAGCGLSYELW